jgi:hypothetical protein
VAKWLRFRLRGLQADSRQPPFISNVSCPLQILFFIFFFIRFFVFWGICVMVGGALLRLNSENEMAFYSGE